MRMSKAKNFLANSLRYLPSLNLWTTLLRTSETSVMSPGSLATDSGRPARLNSRNSRSSNSGSDDDG